VSLETASAGVPLCGSDESQTPAGVEIEKKINLNEERN